MEDLFHSRVNVLEIQIVFIKDGLLNDSEKLEKKTNKLSLVPQNAGKFIFQLKTKKGLLKS